MELEMIKLEACTGMWQFTQFVVIVSLRL